jgi:Ca-activated chloride channel family protein
MTKPVLLVVLILIVGAIIFSAVGHRPAADTSAGGKDQKAAGGEKALTPPWPPATDQAIAVSKDLFAKNYYIVLDGSGSMKDQACSGNQSKMEAAKAALVAFSASVPADANLGLQVFDTRGVNEWLPLGTDNRQQFTRLVNDVQATGNTPLRDSVSRAYAKLVEQGRKQLGYGEYHLVIVTDGDANPGQDPTPAINRLLEESPVVLHTIGFCIGGNHSLNQAGRTVYKAADNPSALRQGLADVLAEAPQFSTVKFK